MFYLFEIVLKRGQVSRRTAMIGRHLAEHIASPSPSGETSNLPIVLPLSKEQTESKFTRDDMEIRPVLWNMAPHCYRVHDNREK
jgi:hypothetical protein